MSATATATDANGCVVCPSTMPATITCGAGEELTLRSITCQQCPEYYCAPSDGLLRASTPVGAIVGGIVGGVAAVLLAAGAYYWFVWRKKHPGDDAIVLSDLDDDKHSLGTDNAGGPASPGGQTTFEKPRGLAGQPAARRLSSYELFTRPQARYQRARAQARAPGPYMDPQSAHRNSVATTLSTTNALNILPIAYIPGVTVRPTKNNTRLIYSYDSESVFSDLNTIENASIVGDIMRANYSDKDTMTAIRAQPRLVSVDRIDEEDEDLDADLLQAHVTAAHVSDLDLDVDSDIGEIRRATSVRRPDADAASSRGLFVLDVEFDAHSEGSRSPFD